MRVLHHPDAARQVPQPRRGLDRRRSRAPRGRRRARAAADLAGHDVLRHRSRRARRARAAAAPAERRRGPRLDPAALPLSRRRSPTTCSTRWRSARRSASTSTCRCSTRRRTSCDGCAGRATARPYDKLLARIRARVPGVTLRTTFIVGFPGETEQDFEELVGFVRDTGFDHVGVFTYSHEEDTRAFAMADDVPADGQGGAARPADAAAEADRRRPARRAQRRDDVSGHGGRPVARVRARLHRPARGPGARHRLRSWSSSTECDPSALAPGAGRSTPRITGARGYDLVAPTPLPGLTPDPSAILSVVLAGKALVVGPCPLFVF